MIATYDHLGVARAMTVVKRMFGSRLRELRRERGLTQSQLAELAQLHQTYVAEIEGGRRNVALENIVYLAKALDVVPGELFLLFTRRVLSDLPMDNRNFSRSRREK